MQPPFPCCLVMHIMYQRGVPVYAMWGVQHACLLQTSWQHQPAVWSAHLQNCCSNLLQLQIKGMYGGSHCLPCADLPAT